MTAAADERENVIEVRGLLSQFGERVIHQDLDLDVKRGEIVGVVGGSGTGKTVLLNSIIGLKQPEGGSVRLFGQERETMTEAEAAEVERRTGVLFQQGALFSSLSVLDNVAAPLVEHTDLPRDAIRELAEMKIALVGLKPESHYLKPAELSGGMKKRAAIARALALEPKLVFFDEPSAGLDPVTSAELDDLISTLNESLGLTVVIVTHELESIFSIVDRAIMLDKESKSIIANGDPHELARSDDPRVSAFFNRQPTRHA